MIKGVGKISERAAAALAAAGIKYREVSRYATPGWGGLSNYEFECSIEHLKNIVSIDWGNAQVPTYIKGHKLS